MVARTAAVNIRDILIPVKFNALRHRREASEE